MSLMKKTTIAVLSSAVVLTAAAGAFGHDRKGGDREGRGPMQLFERADANEDGKLDFAEFSTPMNERFEKIDANSDGVITVEEIETAREERQGRRIERVVRRIDSDENCEISKAEIEERQMAMFERLDADEDGFISLEEAKKMERRGGNRKGKRGGDDRG